MKKEERDYWKGVDAMLDRWVATQTEHDAEVARIHAEDVASGAEARMIARGEAAQRKALAFEDARRKRD